MLRGKGYTEREKWGEGRTKIKGRSIRREVPGEGFR